MATFHFPTRLDTAVKGAKLALLLVPERRLKKGWTDKLGLPWHDIVEAAARDAKSGPSGRSISAVNPGEGPQRIVLCVLPDAVSRHNAPSRAEHAAAAAIGAGLLDQPSVVLACVEEKAHAFALARAVARAAPLYSSQTSSGSDRPKTKPRVDFLALDTDGKPVLLSKADQEIVHMSRWAARLVDMPTSEMTTADFEKAVRKEAKDLPHVKVTSIVGDALLAKNLGGLHAVGRTALVPPRLLLLEYRPPKSKKRPAIIGKGIVYDTGGLSLKGSAHMAGMKADMGGAAAAMGAALALAKAQVKQGFLCAAALAENAIGPAAYRPDDIIRFHSGKTVEINNTDAEGRLVLADAVSYVARTYKPTAILEAATLTGAQLVATGVRHAAVMSNREGLERAAVAAGRSSGDLVAPLPFAPEFFQEEFRSKVADMKNSVANRMNAQSSCAGQFIYSHIQDLDIPWLHVDLAGPAFRDDRATGYGVALLATLLRDMKGADLSA